MNGPRDGGYDDAVSALRSHASQLGELLGAWQARDDSKPDAHARRAASGAADAIDAAIRELHKTRQQLISENQGQQRCHSRAGRCPARRTRRKWLPWASRSSRRRAMDPHARPGRAAGAQGRPCADRDPPCRERLPGGRGGQGRHRAIPRAGDEARCSAVGGQPRWRCVMTGPYETERKVRELPAVRAV
jgi:hypothetical protein